MEVGLRDRENSRLLELAQYGFFAGVVAPVLAASNSEEVRAPIPHTSGKLTVTINSIIIHL